MNSNVPYSRIDYKKIMGLFLLSLPASQSLWAHVIPAELDKLSKTDAVTLYLQLGYLHIVPFGFDHILFVGSLFLLSPKLKPLLWQATAFTVAHSITLGLSIYHVINVAPKITEPLIALSILYVALENIYSSCVRPARIAVVFLFGLIHGLGFAGALGAIGLPKNAYLLSLLMFNIGVELGQLTVILLAWFLLAKTFAGKSNYRKAVVIPLSAAIAVIACFWTIQRLMA